jgi:hypothetical protein
MLNKKVGLIALLVSLLASNIFAGTLSSYSIGDVLLCFRKSGGTNDLVVDLGPVSTFTNATANQRIALNKYTGSQLATIATNNLIWSAFTWFDSTVTPTSIQWTLFASNPRSSLNTQTDPVQTDKQSAQHQAANFMVPVPKGAYDNYVVTNYSTLNSSTAVLEPDNNNAASYQGPPAGQSYDFAITSSDGFENFQDAYQGFPENTTPANFTTAGTVQRSDFYWLPPGNGFSTYGTFLGYFELNTNGVMTYVAYPTAVPAVPVIQSFSRTNTISYIKFTTGSTGTYTLRGTNILTGTSVTNWPAITSTPGNGSVNILQDTTSVSNKFYVITAQ